MCKHLPSLSKPPLLSGSSATDKREHLKTYFTETWELYESLFSLINDDSAYYLRPEPLRHPLIFYYGHTAVFYINKLMLGKYINDRVDADLESICAVGVDEMSWDDLKPGNYQWPEVAKVRKYRDKVKALISNIIDTMPLELPIRKDSLAWIILMGVEHERIHIETSSVIMRMMDLKYLDHKPDWQSCKEAASAPENRLLGVSGTTLTLGKPASNDTYGWDNEYGELPVQIEDFKASEFLVSNAEFMTFIEAGGYRDPKYWTEEGQSWLSFTQAKMPRFWSYHDGQYWQRNLVDEMPLPMDWPVEVNYLEAKAFCNWKSEILAGTKEFVRLPTEAEWQLLRNQLDTDLPDWATAPGNINLEHFASSCPVNTFPQGQFYDVIGNVWQWTESPIDGYEGFEVHPLYDDFSTPTFDGKHNLIKGGSWISTGNEATRDSRYAFRRHFFQHAGFRYVSSPKAEIPVVPVNCYETQQDISQMLWHHYNTNTTENDLTQLASLAISLEVTKGKALDIGCGTGRLAFELAREFNQVDGIDFTARHIQHALQLKEQGTLRYAINVEGELQSFHEVTAEDFDFASIADKLNFVQGDGHNLKPQFKDYDLIVCHRVLDQVYNPREFLAKMTERLNSGGLLLLSCAWQWQDGNVEQDNWLGGIKRDGENLTSVEGVIEILGNDFTLVKQESVETRMHINPRRTELFCNDVLVFRKED